MLREISSTRQSSMESRKRWFTDADMDLFIWLNQQAPTHFQLSYNKRSDEHTISWGISTGFNHYSVDDGEHFLHPRYKMTPILIADGDFDAATVARDFLRSSENIEESLADFIYARLLEYPGRLAIRSERDSVSRDY